MDYPFENIDVRLPKKPVVVINFKTRIGFNAVYANLNLDKQIFIHTYLKLKMWMEH